jgi:hypothetical protein
MSDKTQDISIEEIIELGFTTTLRGHDAVVDLREQYAASLEDDSSPVEKEIGRVCYVLDGIVYEANPVSLANWYMECMRKQDFNKKPPGDSMNVHVDFELPLYEYDDPEYFLDTLMANCVTSGEYMAAKVEAFLKGFDE